MYTCSIYTCIHVVYIHVCVYIHCYSKYIEDVILPAVVYYIEDVQTVCY